jgi:hypothetical protein
MNVLVSVVLVHGAFAESASWNRVIAPLTAAGHRVIAAGNPPRSVATDAAPGHRHRARRGLPAAAWTDVPSWFVIHTDDSMCARTEGPAAPMSGSPPRHRIQDSAKEGGRARRYGGGGERGTPAPRSVSSPCC